MRNMTYQDHILAVEEFRAQLLRQLGPDAFRLVDLALCGYMNESQQARFMRDATMRGMVTPKDGG